MTNQRRLLRRAVQVLLTVCALFAVSMTPARAHDPHLEWIPNSFYDDALWFRASSSVGSYVFAECRDGGNNLTFVASRNLTYIHGVNQAFKMTGVPLSKCCLTIHNAWSGALITGPICFYDG